MTLKRYSQILAPCLFLFFVCLPVLAQSSTATLSGTVEDENSAVVPGAAITIRNEATALIRHATTNSSGSFTIPLLPPGEYTVLVEREGFTRVQLTNIVLNVGDQKAVQVQLKVGDVASTVEVRPDETLVDTSPSVSTTVDRTFVGNLPLNGRSFQSLILLTPGVVYTPANFNNPGEFSVNGQRSNANYFTVDGVSANVGITPFNANNAIMSNAMAGMLPGLGASGSTSSLVSIDALEEFKIQTSTYSAEFGRQPGAQVQLVTRSGGNQFHGTLFEYLRNEAFDARNFFNKKPAPQPPTRQNQFGGTFSGPVFLPRFGDGGPTGYYGRDRTFFFFSYEGQRLLLPSSSTFGVPSLRLRNHPLLSPAMRQILNAFPLPTGDEILSDMDNNPNTPPTGSGGALFSASYADPKSQDATSIRIDHKISNKHTIFGRYNYSPSDSLTRSRNQLSGTIADTRTLTWGVTSSLTEQLNNEFRFNYTRNQAKSSSNLDDFGGAVPIDVPLLLPGYAGEMNQVQGRFTLSTAGSGGGAIFIGDSSDNFQQQFHFVDNLSWVVDKHLFRFGIDYRRLAPIFGRLQYSQSANARIFNNIDEANFLSGRLNSVQVFTQGTTVRPRFDNISAYFQDTWKVSPRLTLDWGFRWEFNPAPSEAEGRNPIFATGVENLATARLTTPEEPWYKTFYTAFAPRFGAAYQLSQKAGHETVLRGGFGVYYDLNSGMATAAYTGYPFIVSKTLSNVQWPLTSALAELPPQIVPALPVSRELYSISPDLRLPYTLQWNLGIEQAFGNHQSVTVSYVASAGRQLTTNQRFNQRIGNPDTGPRPNANFADIHHISNGPRSDYHSLQAQFQRRLSRGFQALVNYTWSHAIDEESNEVAQGTLTRGNASFDIRHNFTAALTYNIPRWTRIPVIDAILRDWSLDTTLLGMSGRPLDITTFGAQVPSDGSFQIVRPDLVLGVPIWILDPNAPGGRRINGAAFSLPPAVPGTFGQRFTREGTLGRNVVRAPGIFQMNMALRRNIKLSEKWNLQLKAEAFNVFNTPIFSGYFTAFSPFFAFGIPSTTLNNSSNAGNTGLNSLYALGGPRSMQFSIRLSF